ncbi:glycoside hydrolase family 24 protein [Janthinobacterium sp. LB2P10]|uniref:glycoside hydrolase family 24 protein n=1 Tax=Janthinobacterium sp. LB2P10 TaxID=3424194 RepID=UPI003F20DDCC
MKDVLNLAIVGGAALLLLYLLDEGDGESANSADLEDLGNQALDAGSEYFSEIDEMTAQANERAFLAAIRVGEGTSAGNGYSILFGGATFGSFDDHPALLGWRGGSLSAAMCAGAGFGPGCVSTAAGAFQINKPTWLRVSRKLGLNDFSPASQDAAAMYLISEKGALNDVRAGRVEVAVSKVSKVWASLPGAGYGQGEVKLAAFLNNFADAGGNVA